MLNANYFIQVFSLSNQLYFVFTIIVCIMEK
jgi:hypothetical protein